MPRGSLVAVEGDEDVIVPGPFSSPHFLDGANPVANFDSTSRVKVEERAWWSFRDLSRCACPFFCRCRRRSCPGRRGWGGRCSRGAFSFRRLLPSRRITHSRRVINAPTFGFLFGFIALFVATLGLISRFIEVTFAPIIYVPRFFALGFLELFGGSAVLPGLLNILTLAIFTGIFYGLIGMLIQYLIKKMK